jgi:hypothetical protein
MAAITKALRNAFPFVRAYESIEGWGTHFLASLQPLDKLKPEDLAKRLPPRAAKDLIEWESDSTPGELFDDVLDGEHPLEDFITLGPSVPPIADDRPINEYFLLRSANHRLPI